MKENIYIRIIKFGIEHPEGFNYEEIVNDKQLKLNEWEENIVDKYLDRAFKNAHMFTGNYPNLETLFLIVEVTENSKGGYKENRTKFIINLDSQFKYIDYLELKEARETSAKAYRTAMSAIVISLISIIVMSFITQTVKIDQQQYDEIKNLIMDKSGMVK